jgi:hypothetical protein
MPSTEIKNKFPGVEIKSEFLVISIDCEDNNKLSKWKDAGNQDKIGG